MTFNAKAALIRARTIIQDKTSVRWPLAELRLWLNDALREIALIKPTAFSTSIVISLVRGTYQRREDIVKVLHVTRNLKSTQESPRIGGRAVNAVDRSILDTQCPDWHDETRTRPSAIVKHVTYDDNEPLAFWVYPPNDGTGIVEAVVCKIPAGVPTPASGQEENIDAYDVNVDIFDIYSNAILDYMLYRAYSKDAQFAGSAQRAAAYYTQFANSIGASLRNDFELTPLADTSNAHTNQGGAPQ